MERTVPRSASDEIDLYLRTIYSLLRSTAEVQIRSLEEVHASMNSSLHPGARSETPDLSAFIYSSLRLPACITSVQTIVLGQSSPVFTHGGYPEVESWQLVGAKARRRTTYYDGKGTLAVFIASQSDIEDVVPVLTAYQIEWNKMHGLLQGWKPQAWENVDDPASADFAALAQQLILATGDLLRLRSALGADFVGTLQKVTARRCKFAVRLLSGSLSEYWRATRMWWDNIERMRPEMLENPVYFVSSNTHSIANLLSGFALRKKEQLLQVLTGGGYTDLMAEWKEAQASGTCCPEENFLYYALKKIQQTPGGKGLLQEQALDETAHGITRIPSMHAFDVEAQLVQLSSLDAAHFDPRLLPEGEDGKFLQRSRAYILNIDYPLGLGAYNILAKIAEHIADIPGVYIMGKAASLNAVRGDVMIPNVVQDEQSRNTYLFQNAFTAPDVSHWLTFGTVFDNQKALSVPGTFLQNARMMDVMYREGYTDIEMEAGPYLSAIYEMTRPKRHPVNEIVNLQGAALDVGILHYVSDTPMSKGANLGAGALSYRGMDSTYATSVAILRRILAGERRRLASG